MLHFEVASQYSGNILAHAKLKLTQHIFQHSFDKHDSLHNITTYNIQRAPHHNYYTKVEVVKFKATRTHMHTYINLQTCLILILMQKYVNLQLNGRPVHLLASKPLFSCTKIILSCAQAKKASKYRWNRWKWITTKRQTDTHTHTYSRLAEKAWKSDICYHYN